MTPEQALDAVSRCTTGFADVLTAATADPQLLTRPVPACTPWTLADLTRHLGEVHRWVVGAVRDGHGRTAPDLDADEAARLTGDPEALRRWFTAGAADLLTVLDGDPAAPAWTFHPPATRGFWQRRQAHENTVHLLDARRAVDFPVDTTTVVTTTVDITTELLDPALAADGVGEVLTMFVPRRQAKGRLDPIPHTIRLVAVDTGDHWTLPATTASTTPATSPEPVAELRAPAADLYLRLWKRLPADHPTLAWHGDRTLGEAVLDLPLSA